MKTLLTIAAIALVTWLGINFFIDGMPSWKTAILIVIFAALVIGTMFMCLRFFTHTLQARFGPQQPAQIVDGADYRTLPNYQAPQAQIAAPRYINVPRFTTNGAARPLGAAPQAPLHLQTQLESGETLTVAYDKLLRFLSLATPTRSEWTGKHEGYSAAMEFCLTHGLLDKRSNGGVVWRSEYPIESRKAWALQFEGQDARE